MRKFNSIIKILIVQFFTIAIILILIEVIGKGYASYNPGHENLYAVPDEFIGWRMTPNLEYTHTVAIGIKMNLKYKPSITL
jgi:hypothetical protein